MVTAAECFVCRPSELNLTGQRRTQQLGARANHLRITAERKTNRISTLFAERVSRRAADAIRRKSRRQLVGVTDSKSFVDRRFDLGPHVERAARIEWPDARNLRE